MNERTGEINTVTEKQDILGNYDFVGGCPKIWSAVDEIQPADDFHPEEIRSTGLPACSCNSQDTAWMLFEVYHSGLLAYIDTIREWVETPG